MIEALGGVWEKVSHSRRYLTENRGGVNENPPWALEAPVWIHTHHLQSQTIEGPKRQQATTSHQRKPALGAELTSQASEHPHL